MVELTRIAREKQAEADRIKEEEDLAFAKDNDPEEYVLGPHELSTLIYSTYVDNVFPTLDLYIDNDNVCSDRNLSSPSLSLSLSLSHTHTHEGMKQCLNEGVKKSWQKGRSAVRLLLRLKLRLRLRLRLGFDFLWLWLWLWLWL